MKFLEDQHTRSFPELNHWMLNWDIFTELSLSSSRISQKVKSGPGDALNVVQSITFNSGMVNSQIGELHLVGQDMPLR